MKCADTDIALDVLFEMGRLHSENMRVVSFLGQC